MRWEKVLSTICPLSVYTVNFITSWQFFWVTKSRGPTIATTLGNYTCKSFIKLTSCFSFIVKDSGVSHAPRERPGRETRFSRLSIRGRDNFQNPSGNSALFFTKHEVKSMIGLASFHTQMCGPILVDCSRIYHLEVGKNLSRKLSLIIFFWLTTGRFHIIPEILARVF